MSDTPCCFVGRRPDLAQIDEALRSGTPVREVARKMGVSRGSLQKHEFCLGLKVQHKRSRPAANTSQNGATASHLPGDPANQGDPDSNPAGSQDAARPRSAFGCVTEEEQVGFLANLIQHNRFHSYRTLHWLEGVWNLHRDTVRARFAAAVEKCAADRAQEIAQKEVALAALEMQETLALREFRRLRMDNPTAARAYLALAMKARTEYADLAGLKTIKSEVNINVWQRTEFVLAVDRFTDAALDVVAPVDPLPLLTRLKDRLAQVGVAPQVVAAAPEVLEAALALLQQDMQARFSEAASGSEVAQLPAVVEGTGQDVQAAE